MNKLTETQEKNFKDREELLDFMDKFRSIQLKNLEKISKVPNTPFTFIKNIFKKIIKK